MGGEGESEWWSEWSVEAPNPVDIAEIADVLTVITDDSGDEAAGTAVTESEVGGSSFRLGAAAEVVVVSGGFPDIPPPGEGGMTTWRPPLLLLPPTPIDGVPDPLLTIRAWAAESLS